MTEDGANSVAKHQTNGKETKINAEPSENDPCMGEGNKEENSFVKKQKQLLREKTGLSEKGLHIAAGVVLLTFILFLIVIVLSAAWPKVHHHQEYPVCESTECLRASAQVSKRFCLSLS